MDGKSTFGQVAMTAALEIGKVKAREHGLSLVNVSNHEHTGRVGTYGETAANEGLASFMCSGYAGGKSLMAVAPSAEPCVSSAPTPWSFPFHTMKTVRTLGLRHYDLRGGQTSRCARKGASLPDYWTIEADGTPSNDPNTYYEGGSLLPLVDFTEVTRGMRSHSWLPYSAPSWLLLRIPKWKTCGRPTTQCFYGSTLILIDLQRLGSLDLIKAQVDGLVKYVKDTPLREGFTEVLYPGEFEIRNRRRRRAEGLYIEDATWDGVTELMHSTA